MIAGISPVGYSSALGLLKECPPLESFKGILTRIYASFGENHGKPRTARSTSTTGSEPGTSRLLVLSVEPLSHWWGRQASHKKCMTICFFDFRLMEIMHINIAGISWILLLKWECSFWKYLQKWILKFILFIYFLLWVYAL